MGRSSVHEHARSQLLTPDGMDRSLRRISHEILERNAASLDDLALVGVLTRGVPLARRISENLHTFEGLDVPVGSLDITLHRDDLAGDGGSRGRKAPGDDDAEIPDHVMHDFEESWGEKEGEETWRSGR